MLEVWRLRNSKMVILEGAIWNLARDRQMTFVLRKGQRHKSGGWDILQDMHIWVPWDKGQAELLWKQTVWCRLAAGDLFARSLGVTEIVWAEGEVELWGSLSRDLRDPPLEALKREFFSRAVPSWVKRVESLCTGVGQSMDLNFLKGTITLGRAVLFTKAGPKTVTFLQLGEWSFYYQRVSRGSSPPQGQAEGRDDFMMWPRDFPVSIVLYFHKHFQLTNHISYYC